MKSWWQSKTIWFNVVTVIATIATSVAQLDFLKEHAGALLGIVAVCNFILRFLTDKPISAN